MKSDVREIEELDIEYAVDGRGAFSSGAPAGAAEAARSVPGGDALPAYVVRPSRAAGPLPAVIYLHSAVGTRATFLDEARELARAGVLGLLIDAPYARPAWRDAPRGLADPGAELALWQRTAAELSRGVDLLLSCYGAAPGRIAFIGRNLGGGVGGFWLTSETRICAAGFLGSIPELSRFRVEGLHPAATQGRAHASRAQLDEYLRIMSGTDLSQTLPRRRGLPLLLQFGESDEWVPRPEAMRLAERAHEPKTVQWFEDGHELDSEPARRARAAWLLARLGCGRS